MLHVCGLKGRVAKNKIFQHVGTAHLAKNLLISIDKIKVTDALQKYIYPDSLKSVKYPSWDEDADLKSYCVKILLKKYLVNKCKRLGAQFDSELDMIYFEHPKAKTEEHHIFKNRQVARSFFNKERTKLNFVRHRSLSIRLDQVQGRFVAMINAHQIFSTDGKTLIRGKDATNLHHKFINPNANNESDFSLIKMWYDILQPHTRTLMSQGGVFFSDLHKANCPVTYQGGETFDATLYEYIEGADDGI